MRNHSLLQRQLLASAAFGVLAMSANAQTVDLDSTFASAPSTYNSTDGTVLQGVQDITVPRAINLVSGTTTLDTSTYAIGLTGNVSGSGALTKAGSGTLTISGTNGAATTTITAGTVLVTGSQGATIVSSGGTLQIGNGGTSGSAAPSIVNGTLIYDRSDNYTPYPFGGATFSGTGTVKVTGGGQVSFLYIPTTFTGGYAIDSGSTLNLGSGDISGDTNTIGGAITDNGTLTINSSATTILNGAITGPAASQSRIRTETPPRSS